MCPPRTIDHVNDHSPATWSEIERKLWIAAQRIDKCVSYTPEPPSLIRDACEILTEAGVCEGAWIAFHNTSGRIWLQSHSIPAEIRDLFDVTANPMLPPCIENPVVREHVTVLDHKSSVCSRCVLGQSIPGRRSTLVSLRHAGKEVGVLALCGGNPPGHHALESVLLRQIGGQIGQALYVASVEVQAQALRKQMEDMYRTVFDHTGTAVWIVEDDGQISVVNHGVELLTGYSRNEIENRTRWEDFFVPEDIPKMKRYRKARLRSSSGAPIQLQSRLLRKNGEIRVVLSTPGLVPNTKRLIVSMIDITGRKRAEERIWQLNEYLQGIIENANMMVVLLDRHARVRVWNAAAEFITGHTRAEVVGRRRTWQDIAPTQIVALVANSHPASSQSGDEVEEFESDIRAKSGEVCTVVWYAKRIYSEQGSLLGVIVLGRDVTLQRQAEKQAQEAERRARQAERLASIGELSARVAHEINNPLTGIVGLAGLLKRKPQSPNAEEYLGAISDGALRIAAIVQSLLTFSRRQHFVAEQVAVNEVIKRALTLSAGRLEEADVDVSTVLDGDLPLVAGDPEGLQQVLLNLISNATSEMQNVYGRRELTLRTSHVDHHVVVEVEDTGRGLSDDVLTKVFEPFYTTKEPGKGTGLGLSICHGIVSEHDGKICAKSSPDGGAVFVIELPVGSQPATPPQVSREI